MALSGAQEKSPEAFRTISEVAVQLDVPQHVLRFWESKFSAIKPLKRGGGRRYYRREDLDLLRGIRALLYGEGITIKGVQKILREQGARYVMDLGRGTAQWLHDTKTERERQKSGVRQTAEAATVRPPVMSGGMATLDHDAPSTELSDAERVRLSELLAELLDLKQRLNAARKGLRIFAPA